MPCLWWPGSFSAPGTGQLNDEPATAARWILTTSESFGPLGETLRALGLFNVIHSPILQITLAVIGLALCVQLADQVGAMLDLWRARSALHEEDVPIGEPLPFRSHQMLHRQRIVQQRSPVDVVAWANRSLRANFDRVEHTSLQSPPALYAADHAPSEIALASDTESHAVLHTTELSVSAEEDRWFAVRHARAAYLRPFLTLGLLVGLAITWSTAFIGWQIATPLLAPGDNYRSAAHDLEMSYPMPDLAAITDTQTVTPSLEVRMAGIVLTRPVQSGSEFRIGVIGINVTNAAPGMLVSTLSGQPALARPGQSHLAVHTGLVFPSPGSEESILLPQQGIGLRIVRRTDRAGAFVLEVYRRNDVQPEQRLELDQTAVRSVRLSDDLSISIIRMPGLEVYARYLPGVRFLWLALAMALIGIAGLGRQPAFLLVQASPWPGDNSVLIMQGNRKPLADLLLTPHDGDAAAEQT